jgi:signal peptidase II
MPEPYRTAPRLEPPRDAARRVSDPGAHRPSYGFLAVVSLVTLVADVGSKIWAEKKLEGYPGYMDILQNHLAFVLAKNKGGAWGLLQGTNENVRRPFFLLVSAAAIAFIMTLYRRLQPRQHALKWGLPLVLGGALGNVFDRIRYGHVIDFIDYRAEWVRAMNDLVVRAKIAANSTDHWPTFNVADIAICIGVGLMAVDMFTARKHRTGLTLPPPPAPAIHAMQSEIAHVPHANIDDPASHPASGTSSASSSMAEPLAPGGETPRE